MIIHYPRIKKNFLFKEKNHRGFLGKFIITWIREYVSGERCAPKFQCVQWSRDKYVHLYPEYEREFERFDIHLLANGSPSFTNARTM